MSTFLVVRGGKNKWVIYIDVKGYLQTCIPTISSGSGEGTNLARGLGRCLIYTNAVYQRANYDFKMHVSVQNKAFISFLKKDNKNPVHFNSGESKGF